MEPQNIAPVSTTPVLPTNNVPVNNTSGQGALSIVPEEIKGWSWGAFGFSWIWGIFNGTFISLLALIPYVNIIMIIILGIKGKEWAWRNKKWDSVEHFKRVQRLWSKVWVIIFFTLCGIAILGVVAAILLMSINAAHQKALQANNAAQSSQEMVVTDTQASSTGNLADTGVWTDLEGRFQITIPSGWEIIPTIGTVITLKPADSAAAFYIISKPAQSGESTDTFEKQAVAKGYKIKTTNLGGEQAISTSATQGTANSITIVSVYSGVVYEVNFAIDNSKADPSNKDTSDFNLILNSLKFLK